VAGNSQWRSPMIHFSATGGTVFNNAGPGAWTLDFINPGETLWRTISVVDAYIIQSSTLPTEVNYGGWWEEAIIGLGMYIPGLPGHAPTSPQPITDSADDFWIFRYMLELKDVLLSPRFDLVIARYGFPGGKVDTLSKQGPTPAGFDLPVQVAWEYDIPFAYNYEAGASSQSYLGMRFWQQSLYLHA
jgi:hypothetical protein